MCLLILGGTAWLGRHLVLEALRAGHAVTCLARARSGPVPDGATWVQADRDDDRAFEAVRLNDWDAVIELARQPGQVRAAAQALAGRCRTYVFISSTSVYADTETLDQDEQAPVVPPLETDSFQTPADYAAGKVACENHARRAFGAPARRTRAAPARRPGLRRV